ncbi:MAG: tRNA 2-selenouridine(34) synthase MnmH [Nanoarchaeota archaeon]
MIQKISITEALQMPNSLFLDVRSPKEYEEDHILGALSLPLLNDEERQEIGLIYKQQSREKAIERGMEWFPEKIPSIYSAVKDHKNKNLIVYCARGGMRSGIIASLLDSIGFNVFQVDSGYKAFRNYLVEKLQNFQLKPKIIVLYGLTCSGKTALLQRLPNSLDLEGLAEHRGSLLGAVGLQPNSQKKFENLLLQRLEELQKEKVIFVEGESRRIGDVILPEFLYRAMQQGTKVFVKRSVEKRVEEAVKEYFNSQEKVNEIRGIIPTLRGTISRKRKEEIVALIDAGEYKEAVLILLQEYYDSLYLHNLKKQTYDFEIENDDVEKAVEGLRKKIKTIQKTKD